MESQWLYPISEEQRDIILRKLKTTDSSLMKKQELKMLIIDLHYGFLFS